MPPGGWDVLEIARVVGADAKRMRAHALFERAGMLGGLERGRCVTSEKDVEYLLRAGAHYGGDPTKMLDLWYEYTGTEVTQGSSRSGSEGIDVERDGGNGSGATEKQIAALAQCVIDLAAIVAVQQRELARLRHATSIATLQTSVGEQASDHLHKALAASARVLSELGRPSAEVSVGSVVQKGTIRATSKTTSEHRDDRAHRSSENDLTHVGVGLELKGIVGRIAGGKLNVAVDSTKAQQRVEELTREAKSSSDDTFEGTFEIEYEGVSIKVGP